MSKKESDISQIRKYLKGELDAKAMHQLERRAQDDPLLMDALEGYEIAGGEQHAQLTELADRLHQRITAKKGRIIPWMIIGIAASVLIICSVGIWVYNQNNSVNKTKIAVNVKSVDKPKPTDLSMPVAENKKEKTNLKPRPPAEYSPRVSADKEVSQVVVSSPVVADQVASVRIKDSVSKDTTPLNEVVVMNYTPQKKKDILKSLPAADKSTFKAYKDTATVQLLQGKVAGVASNNLNAPRQQYGVVPLGKAATIKMNDVSILNKEYGLSKKLITGRVVAREDGLPLPGVSVKIAGTNVGTQTDNNGRFKLPADSGKANLVIGFIGYETQRVSANNRDSAKTIALESSSRQLGEVVVTRPVDAKTAGDDAVIVYSHPQEGWSSFRKYLKENAISPDGKKGVVKLSFMIDRNGKLSDIQVRKGLSPATDKVAIGLISDGPRWVGNTNKAPEKVNLRIRFGK